MYQYQPTGQDSTPQLPPGSGGQYHPAGQYEPAGQWNGQALPTGQQVSVSNRGDNLSAPQSVSFGQQQVLTGQGSGMGPVQGFQGMTVQQLLEAHTMIVMKELATQREQVRLVQQQLGQHVLAHPLGEGLAMGARPSY